MAPSFQTYRRWALPVAFSVAGALVAMTLTAVASSPSANIRSGAAAARHDGGHDGDDGASRLVRQGKRAFRFDTFGDQAFWGGTLHLNETIEGAKNGGIGPGLTPKEALALGLKVDVRALPESVHQGILDGTVNLDDPSTTLALLQRGAVVGVKGFFNSDGTLNSVGIECAVPLDCRQLLRPGHRPPAGRLGQPRPQRRRDRRLRAGPAADRLVAARQRRDRGQGAERVGTRQVRRRTAARR